MRYSNKFDRDFDFYCHNKNKFTFCGKNIEEEFKIIFSEIGTSAKECFFHYDSKGVSEFECSEVELLKALIICKASINLHCKMYAESVVEGSLTSYELKEIAEDIKAPEWFVKSILGQVEKIYRSNKTARNRIVECIKEEICRNSCVGKRVLHTYYHGDYPKAYGAKNNALKISECLNQLGYKTTIFEAYDNTRLSWSVILDS